MKPKAADYGHDGSFMRIEVISMLKLAFVSLIGVMFFTLFIVIGYGGAPAVTRSDYTSNPTRCTSEFSLALFRDCSGQKLATGSRSEDAAFGANASGSVAAIDEVLKLPVDEQVPILSCMFDSCTNTTSRAFVSDHEAGVQVAHYSFGLNGFKHRNRYFYLQVAFPNVNNDEDHSLNVTMTPRVKGFYENTTSGDQASAEIIPEIRQQTLTIPCLKGEMYCESQYFLRFGEIDYTDYQIDVLFNSSESLPVDGVNPQFKKTWGTEAFTNWLIGIKIFFLVTSGLVAIWYNVSLSKLSAREQNMEQGWVAAITVTLTFFNDPFYVVEANYGGNPVKILSLLFQVTFFQMLLLFWLVMLDNLRLQGKMNGVSNSQFFTPKITFIVVFWCVNVIYHAYMKYYSNNDPTWDPLASNAHFALAKALCGAMSIFYIFWIIYIVLLSHEEIRARRVRYRYFVLLNFFMVVMSFIGLGSGAISPAPSSGGQWTLFQTLFNVYVYAIAYLYAPSSTALKTSKKRAQTHGSVDPEASPVLGEPVHPAPLDINDVSTGDLDLA